MQFSVFVISAILGFASAAPSSITQRESRLARRVAARQSRPKQISAFSGGPTANARNSSHVEYSSNWSGVIRETPPSGQTYNKVTAEFIVPTPQAVGSGSGQWAASAWVGIDGDTYSTAILQTGVDFTVTKSGSRSSVSFDAWYEWYPDYSYDFGSITISAGDSIRATVQATTAYAGTAVIENLTTGKTVTKTITSTYPLGGQNAEWIVEDFESGGELVNFADFGTVTFTDCSASTSSQSLGVSDATIIDIRDSTGVLTEVTISGSSKVVVEYI